MNKRVAKRGDAKIRGVLAVRVRSCRICGCTDLRACPDGCWWVGDRLCSACLPSVEATLTALRQISDAAQLSMIAGRAVRAVRSWPVDDRADAYHWAMSMHYSVHDNDIEVPPVPACISALQSTADASVVPHVEVAAHE